MSTLLRWLKFNLIGIVGAVLQLWVIHLFLRAGVQYLQATAMGVEAALLHNFAWHQRYTWSDRPTDELGEVAARLVRFHLSNGAVSIVGNVLLMRWLKGGIGVPVLVANLVAIGVCSLVNFVLGDRFVFGAHDCTA
jgi:putative flippase GtrA